jgi:hypothetical protein
MYAEHVRNYGDAALAMLMELGATAQHRHVDGVKTASMCGCELSHL